MKKSYKDVLIEACSFLEQFSSKEHPPTTIVKLFWHTIYRLILKDIENNGHVFKTMDNMLKDIEKNKKPDCKNLIISLEEKVDLVKEVFRQARGEKEKPDWREVLKDLRKRIK